MKTLLILFSFFAYGCGFLQGEATTKGQDKIPPELRGKGPIKIGKIREYLVVSNEVTLHFYTDQPYQGKRVSFLVSFANSAKGKSRAYLRVKEGANLTDFQLELGSKFCKELAQRIALRQPQKSDSESRISGHDLQLTKLGPSRIRALRALLKGNYSGEDPPK